MRFALMLLAALAALPAGARDLEKVKVVDHFPLYLDKETLQRKGPVATFTYVMAVPKGLGKDSPEGWESTEIEATIDCKGETYSLGKMTMYPEPMAQGAATRTIPAAEPPKKFDIQPRSTALYLAEHICGW